MKPKHRLTILMPHQRALSTEGMMSVSIAVKISMLAAYR
ncbi:MAG: hypothetical protein ACI90U_000822 [Pseudomonadales bacterium]|jgi:hypothetical protein